MGIVSRLFGFRIGSPILSGLVWSFFWLAASALVLSLLLSNTSFQEQSVPALALAAHGFCALAGGFVSARRSGRKGWYFGLANGVLYMLLVLLASFLATDVDWSARVPATVGLSALSGAFGGMLGVNTAGGKKSR